MRFVRSVKHAVCTGSRAKSTSSLPGWFKRMHATNEYNLPRLPVPQLHDTIERYLESVRPLVSENEWNQHAELASQFEKNEGRILQDELLKRELSQAMGKAYPFSYIEAEWDQMYLAARYENPLNVNPAYGLRNETEAHLKEMVPRTASMVRSMIKWWNTVKTSTLEQDPKQCMFGFPRQFGTARIPKKDCDVLESFPRSQHIVVLKDKQFYKLQVLSSDEKHLLSQSVLEQQLNEILNRKSKDTQDVDLSMLTAENRDTWAQIRQDLIHYDPINQESLHTIDSALFILVLDEKSASTTKQQIEWQLHGHAQNSWFDKLQIRVQADGHIGVNFEHSFSDGTVWNRWLHQVWHDMRQTDSGFTPLAELPAWKTSTSPTPLAWKLSNNLIEDIKKAEQHAATLIGNVQVDFLEYKSFAKKDCKKWKWSPDGVAQMALQLAFYQAHGSNPAVYESCSTRQFLHGRTETIRAATPAAKAFIQSVSNQASTEQQRELLETAIQRHVEMAKMAQKGMGCDRHLRALATIATANGLSSAFLNSPVRAASTNFQLSTSNVTTPFLEYFAFGAVVPDGYGIGYLLHDQTFNISMTEWKDSRVTNVKDYKSHLTKAFNLIKTLGETK